jgi:hypothetical protein
MINFGIVEDIDDPKQLGRVRVRVFGIHTHDKSLIPTNSLPWASVQQPTTSAANSGIGQNPKLLNGTLVTVVFMDESMQMPLVLGSVPSEIQAYVLEINGATIPRDPLGQGFQDPTGLYPNLETGNNDLPQSSQESQYKKHVSYSLRENSRFDDNDEEKVYPTSTAPEVESVSQNADDSRYRGADWREPAPANGKTPEYPYNQVRVSEKGITEEWDDSPQSGVRVHNFHPSGTYEEIINDGSKTLKVVGANHEIYLKGSNIYINGNLNFTVNGDKRELITGDYILEVEGDVYHNFHKSKIAKIGEREATEVGLSRTENIGTDKFMFVNGNQTEVTVKNETHITNGTQSTNVVGNATFVYGAEYKEKVSSNKSSEVIGNSAILIGGNLDTGIVGNRKTGIVGFDDLTVTQYRNTYVGQTETIRVIGAVTETFDSTQTTVAGGNIVIVGGPNVYIN